MELNSCLYRCEVMHDRLKPKRHKFTHSTFMFYLDLDEIDRVADRLKLFSRNRFNIYSFYDQDHMEFDGRTVKDNVLAFLKKKDIDLPVEKIKLLTNVRTFGHIFNPVSFYFCFDRNDNPLCVVPEIGNTFREMKPYVISQDTLFNNQFKDRQTKHFYISPFIDLDVDMQFKIRIPGERLNIRIDDYRGEDRFLLTSLLGEQKALSNKNLFLYTLCFPFITLKVIGLIHFHAFCLWLKKIPFHAKEANMHLQKEVLRVWSKN
ncbi:MAG: DUF1365 domain-containing protein [Candidatus Omnitrophica bacterium]|nr:DUF1365 domain-containing protein [Candidatus Omnitrophota bacterium]